MYLAVTANQYACQRDELPHGDTDEGLALAVATMVWEEAKSYYAAVLSPPAVRTAQPPHA
ncbi:hypothetical protein [Rathayibacter rathayi]|uniref:Uncharacterized protein n=1 Tax=Rathayibacter rathayi TaxID=33887 RepID=A0ABX5AFU3_RATRA|nr:hypothetical protein [Rathayibacter rathayi]PPF24236.1 hypothetical protein C5C34_05760 [Rathayibacter rathayi]PPF51557.1 hypothetical protein C5C08_01750 [Rathayibacter rathayi]PPF83148.1 hypothetical protein C5C14_01790 [Rathayibacter rathayi]PPG46978.1 hypothetical protein C5C20_01745 [Rathayibacter rathayi]PPG96560.1 hypothetical protein C5C22_02780 [Rathayibacter rathayi]